MRKAGDNLVLEVGDFFPLEACPADLGNAVDAVQTNILRNQTRDAQWEDNVPPDLTDGFDFLL